MYFLTEYNGRKVMKTSLNNSYRFFIPAFLFFMLLSALSAWGGKPACAQDMDAGPVQVNITDKDGQMIAEFWIRGRLLGRLPQGEDIDKFNARVENWRRRLNEIFSTNTKIQSIRTGAAGGNGVVYNGNQQALIFGPAAAKLLKTTPLKLAQAWAANIRFALKMAPSFTLETKNIIVPLNETVTIRFKGNFNGEVEFSDYDPDIIQVSCDKPGKKIIVNGTNLGKGMFRAKAEGIDETVYFKVQERAGYAPSSLRLEVSGNPAPISLIKEALNSLIYYKSAAKNGAYTIIGTPLNKGKFKPLIPFQALSLIIPVKVDGADYIKSVNKADVSIENVNYARPLPQYLFLSNKPEVITKDGDLFDATMKLRTPVRYFYHHRNTTDAAWRDLYIALENTGPVPAKIFISPVGAGPSSDELFVGHLAAAAYFDTRKTGVGWFVTLKPGTRYLVEKRLVKTGQTVSGVGYLNIIEGAEVKFSVYSATIPGKQPPENAEPYVQKPGVKTARGVFPAFIDLSPVHKIGEKFTYVYLGGEPYQEDINNGNPNYGNYGAFYNIDITIDNPRNEQEPAWIYYIPGGGISRGIFEIDGKLFETPMTSPAQKVLLKKVMIAPGQKEQVRIVTMPQGGAYYPVKIVVESEYVNK